jgi:hypothetical protein
MSTSTVIKELKKAVQLEAVNHQMLSQLQPEQVEADEEPGVEASAMSLT